MQLEGHDVDKSFAGHIGARSVKWVYKINAVENPSAAPVQRKEYLYYTPQVGKQNATYSGGFLDSGHACQISYNAALIDATNRS